jgi:6-phosphogluconate dehydrogenase
VSTLEERERRISELEHQVRSLTDQRRELVLIRAAVDNHTSRLSGMDVKLDVLIDGQASIMGILKSRGQA